MNMSSINGSNNSRKSHNPHKSSLFFNMVWWSVGKSINCHIVEAKVMSVLGNLTSSPLIEKKNV